MATCEIGNGRRAASSNRARCQKGTGPPTEAAKKAENDRVEEVTDKMMEDLRTLQHQKKWGRDDGGWRQGGNNKKGWLPPSNVETPPYEEEHMKICEGCNVKKDWKEFSLTKNYWQEIKHCMMCQQERGQNQNRGPEDQGEGDGTPASKGSGGAKPQQRTKTELCKFWMGTPEKRTRCTRGAFCAFAYGKEELGTNVRVKDKDDDKSSYHKKKNWDDKWDDTYKDSWKGGNSWKKKNDDWNDKDQQQASSSSSSSWGARSSWENPSDGTRNQWQGNQKLWWETEEQQQQWGTNY